MSIRKRSFTWLLLVRVFGYWWETVVLFWVGWYRGWEEKALRTIQFELCSLRIAPSNIPKFMNLLCSVLYVLGVMRV